jgi:hypothetical protein
MVQINQKCLGIYHRLISNKKIEGWNKGDSKDVLISHYSDGRFAVMSSWVGSQASEYFYALFSEKQLHETFTEQFTNLPGFSAEYTRKN